MKKLLIILSLVAIGHSLYAQSTVTIGPGSSVAVGSGSDVMATNRDGTMLSSGTFNSRSIVFDPVAIAATSVTQTSFSANWNSSAGANGYKLDVSTDINFGTFLTGYQNLDVGSAISYTVTGLSAGSTYYYRLRAYDIDGITGYSNVVTLVTAPLPPVASAVSNVTEASFYANWSASTGATKYYLDVATTSGFSAGTFVSGYQDLNVGNVTTYSVNTNLTANTTYYYRVRAANNYGTSTSSNAITVLSAPLPPVTIAATPIGQSSFSVNWNASTGATKYYLDVSTANTFAAGTFVSGYQNLDVSNVTTYSVNTHLTAGSTYYYRVRASNGDGISTNSNTTTVLTVPPNPVATAATAITQTSFTANWGTSTSATEYFIDVTTDAGPVSGWTNISMGNVTTFAVNTSVAAGTTHYYTIRAKNASGTSGNSNVISLVTIPPAPVTIAATGALQTSFNANWNAAAGASKYYLDVSTTNTFTSYVAGWNNLDVGNVLTYPVNTSLTAGTQYYYRVRANNAAGTSVNSNTTTITLIPPDPVAAAASAVATTSFSANWNASLSATGYYLDVATNNTFTTMVAGWTNVSVGNVLTYAVSTNLSAGTNYYYRVRAENATGLSGNSGTITLLTAPDVPTALAASGVTVSSFQSNWNAVAGVSGYYLDVSTTTTFDAGTFVTGFENLDVGNVTSYSVSSNLTAGTTYYYRVRSYNSGGTSGNSNKITVVTLPGNPIPSAATSITASGFTANWNSSTSATGYRLDVSVASDFSSFVTGFNDVDVANVLSYAVAGLSANTTYYYRVRAYNGYGTGGNSTNTTVLTSPAPPTTLAASPITAWGFTANWNSTAGAIGYYLDLSTASDFSSYVNGFNSLDVGNVTSHLISGLSAGSTYYYRVRAYNGANPSANSDVRTVLTLSHAPVASAATAITAISFTANWSASTAATGYRLDVATDAAFTALLVSYNNVDVGNVTSTSVTGLTAGTTYYYRVKAYNGSGTDGNSNIVSVTVIPPAPTEQPGTLIVSNGFNANWSAASGATGYFLDVATNAGFTSWVAGYNNLNVGNVLTYPVTGLSAGTPYYYQIRAYNTGGTSGNSGTVNPTTLGVAPRAPASTPASAITTTTFDANWIASAGATKYFIDVATDAAFTSKLVDWDNKDVGNVITKTIDIGLSAGTSYYYQVRAFNANGTSGNSSSVSLITLPDPPVQKAAASITITSFDAQWNASTGATGYKLDVSTSIDFTSFVTGYDSLVVGNVTSYTVTGLAANTLFHYRIRAYNTGGTSGYSGTTNATTSVDGSGTTVIATSATSIGEISFSANWNAFGGSTAGYRLDVATSSGFVGAYVSGYQDLNVNNVTTYPVTGLTGGTTYYYRVRAYDGSAAIIGNSGTVSLLTVSPAPTATAATTPGETSFIANWNSSTGATGYYLDVATDAGFTSWVTGFQNKYVNNVTTCSVTGLTSGTQYYYQVRAKNGSGVSGNSGSINTLTIPKEPNALAASTVQSTSFAANWDASTGATKYYLDVSTDPAFGSFVTDWNNTDVGNVITFSVNTNINSGTAYYYRLRANNSGGTGGNSGVISTTTAPAAPTANNATSVGKRNFTANWTASTGATKYFVDVAATNTFDAGTYVAGYQDLDVGNTTSLLVTGLAHGSAYYYRVRAFNSNGTSSNSGTKSALTLPAPPAVLPVTVVGETNFTASWNGVTGATKYYLDVSTVSNFSSYVPNWQDVDVGALTSKSVNTDLSAGTTYYFRVRAYDATGLSDNSETMSTFTAPPAPVATAATSLAETNFAANWNSSSGAAGYYLDVSTVSSFASFVSGFNQKDVGNVTSYTVTGLAGGTTYYYRVSAYLGSKHSSVSNMITAVAVPAAPTATSASSIGGTTLDANWNAATGATGYYLDVSTSSSFTSFVAGFNNKDVSNVITYTVTGLSTSTVYYYRVRAHDAGGTGANSNTVSALTGPAAPTATAATTITNTTLNANWNTVAGVSGYRLDVATNIGFTTFVFGFNNKDVGNVTSYPVTGLNGSVTYFYRVRAYNASGVSLNSGTITTTTSPDPSAPPICVAATALTQTSFSANWNSVVGATGYKLDVATDFGFANFVSGFQDLNVGNVLTYSVTGLAKGTTYYYRTRSYNVSGTSSNSTIITTLTIPANPTSTPATTLTETSYTANWMASTGATKYYLDVSTDPGFTTFLTGYNNHDAGNVTTLSITGLIGGTTYYYRVRANNASGTSGNSGNIIALTKPVAPAASAATSVTSTSFSANWTATTGASTYYLDVSTDPAFGSFVTGYDSKDVGNVVTYPVAGLSAYTTYYYRVRASNASGTGSNSGTITVVGVPTANAATSVTATGFDANWTAVAGATKYYIDVSTGPTFSSFVAGYNNKDAGNATTSSVAGLSTGTTYYFRVRAFNASGVSSNSNTKSTITITSDPVATAASSITSTSFSANWGAVTGADGYYLDVSTDPSMTTYTTGWQNKDVGSVTTVSVNTDINGGTTYYYQVRAYSVGGASGSSNMINLETAPPAPILNAASAIAPTSFTINWNASAGATKYYLDVSTDSTFATYLSGLNNKDVGNVTVYPLTGLTTGTKYFYRLRAFSASGTSPSSAVGSTYVSVAPVLASIEGTTLNYTEGNTTAITSAITITDPDNLTFALAHVQITNNYKAGEDLLSFNNANGISGTWDPLNGLLTLTGQSLVASYQAALRSVTYRNSSRNPNLALRTVTFTVYDSTSSSNTLTRDISITPVNDPPQISGVETTPLVFNQRSTANVIAGSLTISDPDDLTLSNADVFVSGNYVNGEDSLTCNSLGGISADWNSAAGTLELRGSSALENYQSVLRSVSYQNTSKTPSTLQRTISIIVRDEGGATNTATRMITIVPAPAVPTLAAPANGATNVSIVPTLTWNAVTGATYYHLQISTSAAFTSTVFDKDSITVPPPAVTGLLNATPYYWRVLAWNISGTSAYATPFIFTTIVAAPDVPTLVAPANGAGNVSVAPTFIWNAVTGATYYHLQISTSATFTSTVLDKDSITVPTLAVTGLLNATPYYWRVSAWNVGGASAYAYASPFGFTTIVAPLAAPALATPANGATNVSITPTLTWNTVTGATTYRLQLATDSAFASIVLTDSTLTITQRAVGPLSNNVKYYWRVSATHVGETSQSTVWSFTTIVAAPGVPTLATPANGATNVSIAPTLTWNVVTGATYYRLQISTSAAFTSTVLDKDSITVPTFSVTGLSNATPYYWRVLAWNIAGTAYAMPFIFTTIVEAPGVPTLATPANGATNVTTSPTLTWNASSGATTYRLQVATDSIFASVILNDSTLTTTQRAVGPLSNNVKYYWRANAMNVGGTSQYSTVWNFTTIVAAPGVPTLVAPANEATNVSTTPTLTWNACSGATTYKLQVATDSNFTTIVLTDSTLTTTQRTVGPLANNLKCYWRVNATNVGGTSQSTVWSFTTIVAAPGAPTLATPANGANNTSIAPMLTWNAATGATYYHVQVSTTPAFATTVVDKDSITGPSFAVTGLDNASSYYWRVLAWNVGGSSPYAAVWSFTTIMAAPGVPTLASPLNAATNVPIVPTLTWSPMAGAAYYHIQVSTSATFTSTVVDKDSLTGTFFGVTGLANASQYYWRVLAWNVGGTSAYATPFIFTTIVAAPGVPTLATPANGAANVSIAPTLTWNAVTGATYYHLQISTSVTFTSTVLDKDSITVLNFTVTGLLNVTPYYWRVLAWNVGGTSTYASPFGFTTIVAAPAVPTLAAPANGATNVSITPTLTWNTVTGATYYHLQISASAAFTSTVLDKDSITVPNFAVTGLLNATPYYWRVLAWNVGGTSAYASPFGFTTIIAAPGAPTLATPANGAGNVSIAPTLTWNAVTGATYYHLQVSTSAAFTSTVLDKDSITVPTFVVTGLLNAAPYYWRVLAWNIGGTSAYASPFGFTTIVAAPGAPTLATPASGATNLSISPTLTWNASSGATTYRLQVAADSAFASVVLNDSTLTTTQRTIGPLSNDAKYYWHVNAMNVGGTSQYSAAWNFTTIMAAPGVPKLTSPANAASNVSIAPTLTWNPVAGADYCRIQISTSATFTSIVVDKDSLSGTSFGVTGLANASKYYWRMLAWNVGGFSAYSAAWSFTTIVATPGIPTLAAPANGANSVSIIPTLTWNASSGATTYRLQLATDSAFASIVLTDSTLTTTQRAVGPLSNNVKYYWRVNATNVGGTSQSTVWNFTTIVALPAIPTLLSPDDSTKNVTLSPTLRWNPSDGATSYHLQVSTSSAFATNIVDDTTVTGTQSTIGSLDLAKTYYWRVRAKNLAGYSAFSVTRSFKTILTTTVEQLDGAVPKEYALRQNYPNPFNPTTTIQYDIPTSGSVSLKLYSILGEQISVLVDQQQAPGRYIVKVNAQFLPSGIYFYQLRTGSFVETKRMVMVK